MAPPVDSLEIVSRKLALLNALGDAAEALAERSKNPAVEAPERAALRNQAKHANESAGALLARGAIDLFGEPPSDAAARIDDAISRTQATLGGIKEAAQAIEFVGALIGVAGAILSGDWQAIAKSLAALVKKAKKIAKENAA